MPVFISFFLPVFPSDFLWREVDKEVSQGGAMPGKKGEEQAGPSGASCVSTPTPRIPSFRRLTLVGKKVTQR